MVDWHWIRFVSEWVGVGPINTTIFRKITGFSLICGSSFCLIVWLQCSNVFYTKSLNGVTYGLLHVVTSAASVVTAVRSKTQSKNVERVLENLKIERPVKILTDKILTSVCLLLNFWLIFIDLYMETRSNIILHLENFSYYLPLVQISMVSNQFMVLVKHVEFRLDEMTAEIKSDELKFTDHFSNYNTLFEICQTLNRSYSLQNLMIVCQHIFGFSFALYYFIQAVLGFYPEDVGRKKLILSSSSSAYYLCYLVIKFSFCQKVQSKAKNFKLLLYDKLMSDPQEAQTLSRRPIFKKIKFSVCEAMDLNHKELKSLMASLITYQVILLQFAIAEKRSTQKTVAGEVLPEFYG